MCVSVSVLLLSPDCKIWLTGPLEPGNNPWRCGRGKPLLSISHLSALVKAFSYHSLPYCSGSQPPSPPPYSLAHQLFGLVVHLFFGEEHRVVSSAMRSEVHTDTSGPLC